MELSYKKISVEYTDQGKGTAVILLHGFLENSSMWSSFATELSLKNRILTIDLLGHGKTGCLGYIHTIEDQAEMVLAVLNHLHLKKYILVGHSMGGYVALAIAEMKPNNIKGLCLMNSTAQEDSEEKKKNRDRAIKAVKHNKRTFIKSAIPCLFSEKNKSVFREEIAEITEEAIEMPTQGIIAALEGMKIRKDRSHILKESDYNKMIVIGKQDPALEYESLIEHVKGTDVKVAEFPDGHMSHIENKTEVFHTIRNFIWSCD
jgi:pimeloyl-ACP methyl ester carboxylesterase